MRVIEATANTVEAIRKAWELRHDLTDTGNSRNYSLTAGKRSQNPGYSGEFKVSVGEIVRNTEEEENPGEIASLELFIRNGLYEGYDNTYPYAGWILLAGKRIAKTPAYHNTFSQGGEYNLSTLYVWHKLGFEFFGVSSSFVFTNEDEMPDDETESETTVYHLLAVIRDGKVIQAHYGPIHIMDRYYDETVTE